MNTLDPHPLDRPPLDKRVLGWHLVCTHTPCWLHTWLQRFWSFPDHHATQSVALEVTYLEHSPSWPLAGLPLRIGSSSARPKEERAA